MPLTNTLLNEVEKFTAEKRIVKNSIRRKKMNVAVTTLALIPSIAFTLNINHQQQTELIEFKAKQIIEQKSYKTYRERTKGDLVMNNKTNKIDGFKHLTSNPFYSNPNYELLKNIDVKGHLSSDVPYIPIGSLKIKDGHLLKDERKA